MNNTTYTILARFSDSAGRFNFMYLAMNEKTRIEIVGDTHIHMTAADHKTMVRACDHALGIPTFLELHVKRSD